MWAAISQAGRRLADWCGALVASIYWRPTVLDEGWPRFHLFRRKAKR